MNKIRFEVVAHRAHSGMLAIFVKCSQYGSSIELDTDVRVFNDEWNEDYGLISKSPNSANLNLLIRKLVYSLEEIELTYAGEMTLTKLHDIFSRRGTSADWYSMWEKAMYERGLKPRTIEIHANVLRTLKRYRDTCPVTALTEEFFRGFMNYLMESGKLKYSTVCKEMHVVKAYYNIARKLYGNKVPADSLAFYHDPKDFKSTYKMKALSDDDVRIIENYAASGIADKSHELVLDQFLFMCYVGTRISDFASLSEDNFKEDNGRLWLEYTSVKTSTPVRLPMWALFDGRAEQIYSKYKTRLSEFFNVGVNRCSFNSKLQVALKKCSLKKHVTAHVARHTCASRLINRDIPITTIQQVIGHRQISMTMIYARINDNAFVRQLQKL